MRVSSWSMASILVAQFTVFTAIGSVAGLSPGYSSGKLINTASLFYEVGDLVLLTPGSILLFSLHCLLLLFYLF